ncbi:hypothetical protein HispidOSU_007386 [Sigmodon hispidus]
MLSRDGRSCWPGRGRPRAQARNPLSLPLSGVSICAVSSSSSPSGAFLTARKKGGVKHQPGTRPKARGIAQNSGGC